ncbi:MAG: DHHW family protein, partial [Methylocystaceae bacterium]
FNTILFLIIIFVLTAINLGSPNKPTVSATEKRVLAPMPSFTAKALFSGSYFRGFEAHFSDTFAFREGMARAGAGVRELKGVKVGDQADIFVNHNAGIGGQEKPSAQTNGDNNNGGQLLGTVLILSDRAMEVNKFNPQTTNDYAEAINQLQERLGNTRIYSLLAPTQIEFSAPKYRELSYSEQKVINYVNRRLTPTVVPIDAYKALQQHTSEYIFFRTDHHWTALGAYYAYCEFIRAAGADPIPLNRYKQQQKSGFEGSFYNLTLNKALTKNPDTLVYYQPLVNSQFTVYRPEGTKNLQVLNLENLNTQYKYSVFLGGDHPLGIITTDVKNGKKLAIIKDSYGNAFIPFLLPHYQEILVIDPRYYKDDLGKMIRDHGVQELLVLDYAIAPRFETYVKSIQELTGRTSHL